MKKGRRSKAELEALSKQEVWSLKLYPAQEVIDLKKLSKAQMEDMGLYYATTDIYLKIPWKDSLVPLNLLTPINIEAEGVQWTHMQLEPILKRSGMLISLSATTFISAMFLGDIKAKFAI